MGRSLEGSHAQAQVQKTLQMSRLNTEDLSPEAVHVLEKFVETHSESLMRSAAFLYHNIEQRLHLNSNQQSHPRQGDVPLGCWMYPVTSATPSTPSEQRQKSRLRTKASKTDSSSSGNGPSTPKTVPASSGVEENHALLFHLNHWDDAIALRFVVLIATVMLLHLKEWNDVERCLSSFSRLLRLPFCNTVINLIISLFTNVLPR